MEKLQCIVDSRTLVRNINRYDRPVLLMIKADAYGLGARETVAHLDGHVLGYGVATQHEGMLLRSYTDKPILVTTPWWDDASALSRYALTPLVGSAEQLNRLVRSGYRGCIHLKVNSGMNRFGVATAAEAVALTIMAQRNGMSVRGIATHYAQASARVQQNKRFAPVVTAVEGICGRVLRHAEASSCADTAWYDMVRVGMNVYRNSVHIQSEWLAVHAVPAGAAVGYDGVFVAPSDGYIGVLCGGYADGLDKRLIGHNVYANGEYHPIVAVCMDVCLVWLRCPCRAGQKVTVLDRTMPCPQQYSLYEMYTALHRGRAHIEWIT